MIRYGYPITLNYTGVSVVSDVSNLSVIKFWDTKGLEHECAVLLPILETILNASTTNTILCYL